MPSHLTLALAQLNPTVGAIEYNTQLMLTAAANAAGQGADLVLFPELAVTGYPPEDLLFRDDLHARVDSALGELAAASQHIALVVGHPWREDGKLYNAASFFYQGRLQGRYFKQLLPNYGVFDEKRYFAAGTESCVIDFKDHKLGLLICEDVWEPEPMAGVKAAGAGMVLSLNASPYYRGKAWIRKELLAQRSRDNGLALVYLNQVGGQDELVFDGRSKVFSAGGELIQSLPAFTEALALIHIEQGQPLPGEIQPVLEPLAEVYQALVLATRDYVNKNGFNGAVLGLSGGIDSALTLAIAVDALGKDKVQAVMMPFRYTASISVEDAREEAEHLGVEFDIVSIEPMFDAFMGQLAPMFEGTERDTTEENLQARSRGVLLMAISNKRRRLVLTTGNKSEVAVGYCTLYGDMVGGFAPIKDVPKTLVFELSRYRNTLGYVIPQRVIDRPPSAELAPDQLDQDSLPPYDVLDAILEGYVEQDKSLQDLLAAGFNEADVRRVIKLVDINEYKRRQSAVGPRITARNFGKDRRYPITSGFGKTNW
ncbi:NAD+ synthase [Oceanimonas baumannii]|uniref:Glutamine-dependent NAD(+) synthetase n=1 Tax=Oceanimonas baumannii TaxID=129578 RepID=A0A235CK13_9GAMM|nr:NAD+ synthase [Oceanimonas baumannii]OYD24769.1 NAD+ synthase [Oceanimonas baumannii]TDW59487.1 NAD+ synthase (glutamine-hydrolysing) [Oceanimonas baumannii]